jgi:protein-L-isoaspartate(D-aspartate) O-methyltransferase
MRMADADFDAKRLQMINGQLRTSGVNDLDLLAAFEAVPREKFVAPAQISLTYSDRELASTGPAGRRLLTPRTLGLLLKSAAPVAGERALTVGAGSGYCAALLAALGLDVVALETDASAAKAATAGNPRIRCVDGPLTAPPVGEIHFDLIVINGAFEVAPEALLGALRDGGRLVGLSARGQAKRIVLFEKVSGGFSERALFDAPGEILPGFARPAAFAF